MEFLYYANIKLDVLLLVKTDGESVISFFISFIFPVMFMCGEKLDCYILKFLNSVQVHMTIWSCFVSFIF